LGAIFTELGNTESGVVVDSLRQRVCSVVEKLASGKEESIRLSFHFYPPDHAPEKTPVPALHGDPCQEPQSNSARHHIKRAIDVICSILGLILLSPLLFAISILIKLTSSGPMLFRQTRIGQFGKEFTFLKFRSMYRGSDPALHREYVSHFIAGKAP